LFLAFVIVDSSRQSHGVARLFNIAPIYDLILAQYGAILQPVWRYLVNGWRD